MNRRSPSDVGPGLEVPGDDGVGISADAAGSTGSAARRSRSRRIKLQQLAADERTRLIDVGAGVDRAAAVEDVRSLTTLQDVSVGSATETIVARAAGEVVDAGVAAEVVVALAADQVVATGIAPEAVRPRSTEQ